MPTITIRFASPDDVPIILDFIKRLAAFENELDAVKTTQADLLRDGFGPQPKFEVLVAELAAEPVGFALFFLTYSTWEGRPSLYLEDLFVVESARKHGVGRQLMARLAAIAVERGYKRLDLQVLNWNPAREFYRRLDMDHMYDWLPYRLSGKTLQKLAAESKHS
jgi:GNAT superfamily N-acetyltransferase